MRQVLERASPIKKEKRKRFFSKFLVLLFILIALFIGLGIVSGIPKLVINEAEVDGTESLDKAEVAQKALTSLSGKKLFFYSKANIFLFSKSNLSSFIAKEFPRIYKVVSVDRTGQKLQIVIEERHAAYTWCGHEAPSYASRWNRGKCYFLDQSGFAFAEAPNFSEGVYLSIYGGLPADSQIIGETINLSNNISDVAKMLLILEDNNLPVHSLVITQDGQHQFLLDTYSLTGDYAKILWNEDAPLADTLEKLGSAISEDNFRKGWEEHKERLLYVDTRFNNRVFYKFQDEGQNTTQ